MSHAGMIIGLPGLEVVRVKSRRCIDVWARPYRRQASCTHCGGSELRIKATHKRTVKHTLLTQQEWQHYSVHGFVNVGGILSDDLLQRLTQAAVRIRERVRDGSLYHGFIHRTGIAAPGFPCGPQGGLGEPWLARGLFSPQHAEPVFGEYLAHPRLMRYCADFLGCASPDDLLLCDTSLLISPRDADFSVGWHFDYDKRHQESTDPITTEQWQASEHTPARRGILQFNCTLAGQINSSSCQRAIAVLSLRTSALRCGKAAEAACPQAHRRLTGHLHSQKAAAAPHLHVSLVCSHSGTAAAFTTAT